ncbi:2-phospho-L-lactate transferase [Trinickia mobilis]|uniref:2-phospho-L-lactate transferase n=1 Tax=Trinickia mobilis TaxID=2816356 RepID=UPI001A8D566C|nr:2-phospho-L-lactate transferase [Trinickia mobilis]
MDDRLRGSRVVLLAGGVGGARMAAGFDAVLRSGALTIVANVGDDERFYGLQVCPDLDTLLYTLAGAVDPQQGWGVAADTTRVLDTLSMLGAPTWMKLGDADFGLHIYRSWRLAQGARLTDVMREAAQRMGLTACLLPATDTPTPTEIEIDGAVLRFQQWFVAERAKPAVRGLHYAGAQEGCATPEVMEAIEHADLIVIAPSNPLLSIEPMLALPGVRQALRAAQAPCIAVSPLINGKAIKGPLDRMLADMGLTEGNEGIAERYSGLIDGLVVDASDAGDVPALRAGGLAVLAARTLIHEREHAAFLARQLLAWSQTLRGAPMRCEARRIGAAS